MMRGADRGFVVALGAAAAGVSVGFAVFPPGAPGGLYPALTAWGPAAVLAAGGAALLAAAAGALLTGVVRRLPAGRQVYVGDGGAAALGLSVLPLAAGPWAAAAAVAQLGQYGLRGALAAALLAAFGLAAAAAGAALAWTREEIRVEPGRLVRIDGRGWPRVSAWPAGRITWSITPYRARRLHSFVLHAVIDGRRVIVARARTEADAEALRDGILRDLRA